MKEYKKPSMMTLSISANDALCGGCGTKLKGDGLSGHWLEWYDENGDGRLDELEFGVGAFGQTEAECEDKIPYMEYCKYTVAESENLFWS